MQTYERLNETDRSGLATRMTSEHQRGGVSPLHRAIADERESDADMVRRLAVHGGESSVERERDALGTYRRGHRTAAPGPAVRTASRRRTSFTPHETRGAAATPQRWR